METQTPSRDVRLAALRGVHQQTFRQYLLEVRAQQSLASCPTADAQAMAAAARRLEGARLAYRQSRDARAQYLLDRRPTPVALAQAGLALLLAADGVRKAG
jgi:hypothetical protein